MAELTVQTISLTGLSQSLAAAASGGDTVLNNGRTVLAVKNSNGSASRTVTIDSRTSCDQGSTHDIAVVVTAGVTKYIGPFPTARFNTSDGKMNITYSDSAADITIAALSL